MSAPALSADPPPDVTQGRVSLVKSSHHRRSAMRISTAFPSKYLKASDIPDGREAHVKIDMVQLESMETTGDEKPVMYFIDREKGLVLNKTNADALSAALGDDTEQWRGVPIVLFATTTAFGGRTVPCLRVRVSRRPLGPALAPAGLAPAPQDDIAATNHQLNGEGNADQADIPF